MSEWCELHPIEYRTDRRGPGYLVHLSHEDMENLREFQSFYECSKDMSISISDAIEIALEAVKLVRKLEGLDG